MELLQQRGNVVHLFLVENKTSRAVLNALETIDRRSGKTSKKGVTIVQTRENGRSDKFGCGVCCEKLAYSGNAAELKVAGARDRRDVLFHGEGVV